MCAINGITTNNRTLVERMNEATRHRGPDGSRIWEGDGITLGHNRLAIIDLSLRALQPMEGANGRYQIVFNGEIYNYRELREELKSRYDFKTESDTEVLVAAYHAWGETMFTRLRGIFAFGIWDNDTEELILARDHMGVKPLYYEHKDGVLRFSSELCAFQGEGLSIENDALAFYFRLQYVPSPVSIVKGIKKLRPGQFLTYREGVVRTEMYYLPNEGIGVPQASELNLYDTIERGVVRQMVSDRPIGMFLSGGLDSSIVLHHMSAHAASVQSFSVDFEMVEGAEKESDKFNTDARLAEKTASLYGAAHKTFTLTLGELRKRLPAILESLDEPVANPTAVAQYFLSEYVQNEGVVVALGGDGGDELFGGYTRHRALLAGHFFQKFPSMVRQGISSVYASSRKLGEPFPVPIHIAFMANDERLLKNICTKEIPGRVLLESYFSDRYEPIKKNEHPIAAFMRVDRETWLPDESLTRSDRTSMAHGLELRVPLLDLDIVTYADTIPVWKKLDPWTGKKQLRNIYRAHLPDYIFKQPKRGWISPGAKWLRDPILKEYFKEVLSPHYYEGTKDFFNWQVIEAMFAAHDEKRGYFLYPLWNIILLQVWARKNGVTF